MLTIIKYGNPVLRQVATEVFQSEETELLINEMMETMLAAKGAGLAAPQVGKSLRLFIGEKEQKPNQQKEYEVYINPVILMTSETMNVCEEGCLSIPGIYERVMRPAYIGVEYLDRNFKKQTRTLLGWEARVFQHEYDHIDGVLFTDKITDQSRKLFVQEKLQGK